MFRSRIFGDVAVAADGAYVTREASLGSRSLTRSLFLGMELDQALLDRAASFVDTLETLDIRAREAIEANVDACRATSRFTSRSSTTPSCSKSSTRIARPSTARHSSRGSISSAQLHARPPNAFSLVLDYSVGEVTHGSDPGRQLRHGRPSGRGEPGELRSGSREVDDEPCCRSVYDGDEDTG